MKLKGYIALLVAIVLVLAMVSGCAVQSSPPETQAATRQITDMAGRVMYIPAEVGKVFSTNPISAIYLYTLAPGTLLGWNYELNETERSVILAPYRDLPNFGRGDGINFEAVIAAGPDIALTVTSINQGQIEQADRMAENLGIPVVVVSDRLEGAPQVYRLLGEILGIEERGEKLAEYAQQTFDVFAGSHLPEERRVRVYFGNGEDSLQTAPAGSPHGQLLDMVGAINVADLELGDGSRMQISLEQLLAWDPDVIIVNGEPTARMRGNDAAEGILNHPDFATLSAVQNSMVFGIPNAPFSWVDRPPGPNRIIGVRWLAIKLYPEYFEHDLGEEVREFFRLFYHVELTDAQLAEIL